MSFNAKEFLATVSDDSGVYRMYDAQGKVLYVGKAQRLRTRLASYFRSQLDSPKTAALVAHIAHIDVTLTASETAAYLLEHHFITAYRPKYNILLKDDKAYPWLVLTAHPHPALRLARRRPTSGEAFGPFPSAKAVKESLRTLQRVIPIRQCSDSVYAHRSAPCYLYDLNRCSAPCVPGYISSDDYSAQVALVRLFLQGKYQPLLSQLETAMHQASQALAFETAARYRDQLQAMQRITQQHSLTGLSLGAMDALGLATSQGMLCLHVLLIRDGRLVGSKQFFPASPLQASPEESLAACIMTYYTQLTDNYPATILLPYPLPEAAALMAAIQQERNTAAPLRCQHPQRGEKKRLVTLAQLNAQQNLKRHLADQTTQHARLESLRQALNLPSLQRIECLDISHTQGEHTQAACVVFDRHGPLKQAYQRYNIRNITPGDDYAAMAQALTRRITDMPDNLPDIFIIDGGKGQLRQAEHVLQQTLPPERYPYLLGVAKDPTRHVGAETLLAGFTHIPLDFQDFPLAWHLVLHCRDEAHRFAITGHRKRRSQALLRSRLDDIPGIGAVRRQRLLAHLGGLQGVQAATVEMLCQVPGINLALASTIYQALHPK